jgi:hypothetical protein
MSIPYASGRESLGNCDVCAQTVPYKELRRLIVNLKDTGLRVCADCWNADHPQYLVGKYPIFDPQALEHARPDLLTERGLFGWDPVLGNLAVAAVGTVKIVVM